jgi:hypothetical protein
MARSVGRGLLLLIIVVGAVVALDRALPRDLQARVERPGTVLRLEVLAGGVVWLEGPAGGGTEAAAAPRRLLLLSKGSDSARVLVEDLGIADFWAGDAVYYVTTGAGSAGAETASGALARVSLQGGAPEIVGRGLRNPAAVALLEGWICWTETDPPPAISVPVLPLTRSVTHLRAMPAAGGPVQTLVAMEGTGVTLRLLGEADGHLFWLERRTAGRSATLVKRARVPDASGSFGEAETLITEEGVQEGILSDGALIWTGASRESAPPRGAASVNRRTPDGRVTLLGDWLGPEGALAADGGRIYYCHLGVTSLPGDAGMGQKLVTINALGPLTRIFRGNVYAVERGEGREYRIVRQPLTTAGRWAAALGAVP